MGSGGKGKGGRLSEIELGYECIVKGGRMNGWRSEEE